MSNPVFSSGQCLNCDHPITSGILCSSCFLDSPADDETISKIKTILEMDFLEEGYTTPDAFMEEIGNIWILRTAQVTPYTNEKYCVRIRKSLTSIIEVDYNTLSSDLVFQDTLTDETETNYFMAVLTRMKS